MSELKSLEQTRKDLHNQLKGLADQQQPGDLTGESLSPPIKTQPKPRTKTEALIQAFSIIFANIVTAFQQKHNF